MGLALAGPLRSTLGGLATFAVVGAVAVGLPALDRAVPAGRALPPGVAYEVGGGVTVVPPLGALLDAGRTRPHPDRGRAVFLLDQVRYALLVTPSDDALSVATGRLRTRLTGTAGLRLTDDERSVTTSAGVPGIQGGYTGPEYSGSYAVYVVGGVCVEAVVTGPTDAVAARLPAVEASLVTISTRRPR